MRHGGLSESSIQDGGIKLISVSTTGYLQVILEVLRRVDVKACGQGFKYFGGSQDTWVPDHDHHK